MLHRILRVCKGTVTLYLDRQIPRSAAALSYYLTMSLFPLVICLYTLLGGSYGKMLQLLELLDRFLSAETTRYVKHFLEYVAKNHSPAMLFAGVTLLLTSSSSAVHSLQTAIGEMQGGTRYKGLRDFVFSLVFSLAFLAAMYFAILVMLTGQDFLELVESYVPVLKISRSWTWLRFLILGGIEFVILWGMYEASLRQEDPYSTAPGAIFGTIGIVVMSWVFSVFIAVSARYPLVYGSLASLVLLMFWLFLCCQIIILGAALNVAVRDENRRNK